MMHQNEKTVSSSSPWTGPGFFLIAGPCVVESVSLTMEVADRISEICKNLDIPWIFKASFRKANRSRVDSFMGIGDQQSLELLGRIREEKKVWVTTDIHAAQEAEMAAPYVDILQIPAFLCRQTDILEAAAATGRAVNVKKGQFLSPEAMQFVAEKLQHFGAQAILLTERGSSFGYQDLIVDFRGIPKMKALGHPVVMDCTHSLQQPNQATGVTGGDPAMIETIARAAIAVGADGLFIETHPRPAEAKSDGANMLPLDQLESLLKRIQKIRAALP